MEKRRFRLYYISSPQGYEKKVKTSEIVEAYNLIEALGIGVSRAKKYNRILWSVKEL